VIRLFGSELLRFRSRRLVLVLLLLSIVVAVIAAMIAGFQSTPPGEEALAEARAQAEQEYQRCLSEDWDDADLGGLTLEEFCRENFGNPEFFAPSHLRLAELPEILEGTATVTIIIGLVLGASAMAVSWQTGTIGTILTWEPRRMRWYTARAVVAVAGAFVVVLAILAFLSVSLAVAAWLRGSVEGADAAWWRDVIATSLRIGVAAAIAAALGAGVAAVGRHTAAALGVVFVYAAVLEGIVRAFRPLWTPWLLGDNIVSFVSWQSNSVVFEAGSYVLSPGRAAFVILGYAAIAFLLGLAFVRTRDVQ
jgi:ABC-2 type transport system permease protein